MYLLTVSDASLTSSRKKNPKIKKNFSLEHEDFILIFLLFLLLPPFLPPALREYVG